jgi:hypothetical protein
MSTKRVIIPELEESILKFVPKVGWTEKELQAVRDYYGLVPTRHLAAYLHRSKSAVNCKAEEMGIRFGKTNKV